MGIDTQSPKPLYLQIIEDIKAQILSKQLKPGDKLASHHELTRAYDVSLITVKRALNEMLKEGLLYSRAGKGTYVSPNVHVGSLSDQGTLGFVLTDFKNPFFTQMLHTVEKYASQSGYHLIFSYSSDNAEKEESQILKLKSMGVQGLIVASTEHVNEATPAIRQLHSENFPYIMVSYIDDDSIYYVGTDHEKGAFLAAEHLIKLGYQKIGFLNAELGNHLGELRKRGFVRALEKHTKVLNEQYQYTFPYKRKDYESGYSIGEQFSQSEDRPDALFIYNDASALGFQHAVLNAGLKIPEDVAIVGFDDIRQDLRAQIPLTTVHQPTEEIGKRAVENLIKRINQQSIDVRTILDPCLVIRVSCGTNGSISKYGEQQGCN